MVKEGVVRMSQKEIRRAEIVSQVASGFLLQKEAAAMLSVSTRQMRRLLERLRCEGIGGLAHKLRGHAAHNRISEDVRENIAAICRESYEDFGPTFAAEKLKERDGISVSDEWLRKFFISREISYPDRRSPRKHRRYRQRRDNFGAMLQFDGSRHRWFDDRGPECVLMVAVDDATGTVMARFYEYEGTLPAMDLMLRYIRQYGIPQSVYADRHSTYCVLRETTIEEELAGLEEAQSQFARALAQVGCTMIHAQSPQAKGRVERENKTLQDRLVKELRLAGISDIASANRFLEKYLPKLNKRFAKPAASNVDVHGKVSDWRMIKAAFCVKTTRALRNDNTIRHDGVLYQIDQPVGGKSIEVCECPNGTRQMRCGNQDVRYHAIVMAKRVVPTPPSRVFKPRQVVMPAREHPWRSSFKIKKSFDGKRLAGVT
jgi:transposase